MPLKVGFDIFAGTSQAGIDAGIPGNLQAETVAAGKHGIRVQRKSDSYYWNNTSGAFQSGATAEADELYFKGSVSHRNIQPSKARLMEKLPKELLDDSTADGLTILVYPEGEQATGAPTTATLDINFLP